MSQTPEVKWEPTGEGVTNDFSFTHGEYVLRVEKMNRRCWWWCVYYGDEYAGFDEPKAKTEQEAKLLAELCFVRHQRDILQSHLTSATDASKLGDLKRDAERYRVLREWHDSPNLPDVFNLDEAADALLTKKG